jgi:hypothetical protein
MTLFVTAHHHNGLRAQGPGAFSALLTAAIGAGAGAAGGMIAKVIKPIQP